MFHIGMWKPVLPCNDDDKELLDRALKSGAEPQWVTPGGYTRLPEEMRNALDPQSGGHLWFLRSKPEGRWEAWIAAELDQRFALEETTVPSAERVPHLGDDVIFVDDSGLIFRAQITAIFRNNCVNLRLISSHAWFHAIPRGIGPNTWRFA